jgi:hypothetical protein
MQVTGVAQQMTRSLLPAIPLLLAVVAAGCGGQSPNPSSGPTPATPPPSTAASAASRHADPELEALLPETLGAVALTRESQRGVDLAQHSPALETFLDSLDKTLDDFTLASAYASAGDLEAQVGAWQIRGADTALLMPGFIQAIQASSTTPLTVTEVLEAGQAVTKIGEPGQLTQGPLYAFARGDTVLFVQTTDPALASEALSDLR